MMTKEQTLAFQIRALNNQIRRQLEKNALPGGGEGLTGMHYGILGYLSERDPRDTYQRDIEAEFNIRRSTASGILKLMEKNGYITRTQDETDTRLKLITPTEKAKQLEKIAQANITNLHEKMTKGIPKNELDNFYKTLKKISENLEG